MFERLFMAEECRIWLKRRMNRVYSRVKQVRNVRFPVMNLGKEDSEFYCTIKKLKLLGTALVNINIGIVYGNG